ncbi:MAG: FxsA family protein [Myxococcota bacterium]|nr:FxsA family protein [Myxococcota bacterium]
MCGPFTFAIFLFIYLEFSILLRIAARTGGANLLLLIIGSALIGRYGLHASKPLLARGGPPPRGLNPEALVLEPALLFLGSALLVFPGVISDIVGLLLFIPPLRLTFAQQIVSRGLHQRARSGVVFQSWGQAQGWGQGAQSTERANQRDSIHTGSSGQGASHRETVGEAEVLEADAIEVGPERTQRGNEVREINRPPPKRSSR